MYRLVIFDWDGTLMDSTGRIVDCLGRAAAEIELPALASTRLRSIIGLGLPEAIRALYPEIDAARLQAMRERYAAHYVAAEQQPSALFPGALDVLDQLRADGTLLAVATGKSRRGLDRVWSNTGFGEFFVASRCADESRSKPHPAMVYELLDELHADAHEALVVGDTSFDLEMASRAGVDRVGVSWGAHDGASLQKYQPLAVLEHFHELLPLVGGTLRPEGVGV